MHTKEQLRDWFRMLVNDNEQMEKLEAALQAGEKEKVHNVLHIACQNYSLLTYWTTGDADSFFGLTMDELMEMWRE